MVAVRRLLLLTLSAALLAACGGAALGSGAEFTATPPRAPLADLETLQRDFDLREAELHAQLERNQAGPPMLRREKAEGDVREEEAPRDEARSPQSLAAPACDSMCRALASMRRSADGICAITTEPHERCVGARGRLQLATEKVAAAGCACPL